MKKYLSIITWAVISLVLVCFIFSNSFACKEVSIELSRGITDLLYDCVKSILKLSFDEFHGLVRKVAHFVEFALFGASVWMTMDSARNLGRRFNVETVLFLSLTVAVIDEFIQSFTGRGSMVADVILDFAGALFGIVITATIIYFVNIKKQPSN